MLVLFALGVRVVRRGPRPTWVYYELDGTFGRGLPGYPPSWLFRSPRSVQTLVEFERELAFIRTLPWVKGVVLRFEGFEASAPVRDELREMLGRFRTSGKAVLVHADRLDAREYGLAAVADRVWLTPQGRLELTGVQASATAAGGLLGRLGVRVSVVRAGRFKSAGELFGAERVSDENKEQTESLVDDVFERLVGDIASGRKRTREEVEHAIDGGPYSAKRALDVGLVDGLCYADELGKRLAEEEGRPEEQSEPGATTLRPFAALLAHARPAPAYRPLLDRRPTVAVLDIEGMIAEGRSRAVPGLGATAGSRTLVQALRALARNRRVASVVLRIDSRGGSALASDLIWHAVRELDAKKPVVAFLDSVAASGGYYIAAAARHIVASPVCVTGSIGVFSLRPDVSGVFERLGIDRVPVRRGERAGMFDLTSPLDDASRDALQRDIDETWATFAEVVAQGRKLSTERARELADGRVVLSPRALALGLVDELGTLDDAVAYAAKEALLDDWRVRDVTPRESRWTQIKRLVQADEELRALERTFSSNGLWAHWAGKSPG